MKYKVKLLNKSKTAISVLATKVLVVNINLKLM